MPTLRDWLREGDFALAMSSGFFGFFAHAGFLSVLEEESLLPTRVAGSSAGALVGSLWASGLDASTIRDELLQLERAHFWDPALGLGLLHGRLFRALLEELMPVARFEACRVPLGVSAFDVVARQTQVLDSGPLAPAVHASCAVPFMFRPVWIEGRPYLDGGLLDRPGLAYIPSGERVLYHHLSSRSPWRRAKSPALRVPERVGMASLIIDGLPRVGPFRLRQGRHAYDAARRGARASLDRRLERGSLRLDAT